MSRLIFFSDHWLLLYILLEKFCSGKSFCLCRKLAVLDGMGGCLTVISFLMISHIISFEVLRTGSQSIVSILGNFRCQCGRAEIM